MFGVAFLPSRGRSATAFLDTLNPFLLVRVDIFVLVDFATSHRKFIPLSLVTRRGAILLLRLSSLVIATFLYAPPRGLRPSRATDAVQTCIFTNDAMGRITESVD